MVFYIFYFSLKESLSSSLGSFQVIKWWQLPVWRTLKLLQNSSRHLGSTEGQSCGLALVSLMPLNIPVYSCGLIYSFKIMERRKYPFLIGDELEASEAYCLAIRSVSVRKTSLKYVRRSATWAPSFLIREEPYCDFSPMRPTAWKRMQPIKKERGLLCNHPCVLIKTTMLTPT